jgi:hypothetical protein
MQFIIRFGFKTFKTSLRARKYLLAKHLFNDNNGNNMELLKGKQMEHIQDKFIELNSPNVRNLLLPSNIIQGEATLTTSLN